MNLLLECENTIWVREDHFFSCQDFWGTKFRGAYPFFLSPVLPTHATPHRLVALKLHGVQLCIQSSLLITWLNFASSRYKQINSFGLCLVYLREGLPERLRLLIRFFRAATQSRQRLSAKALLCSCCDLCNSGKILRLAATEIDTNIKISHQ